MRAVALDIPNPFQGSIEETREASQMPATRSASPETPVLGHSCIPVQRLQTILVLSLLVCLTCSSEYAHAFVK